MTNNQIQYQRLLEEKRSHSANEELERAKQGETSRHNLATEIESNRTNLQNELLKQQGNIITEDHYKRSDALGVNQLAETIRNNKATLQEQKRSNIAREYETRRSNQAREYEQHRSNEVAEAIKREANSIQAWRGAFPGSSILGQTIANLQYDTGDPRLQPVRDLLNKINRPYNDGSMTEAQKIEQARHWQ